MTTAKKGSQLQFDELNPEFYDLEYFLSLEYRYFSGAHGSKIRNILSSVWKVEGLRCLDVGCGEGTSSNPEIILDYYGLTKHPNFLFDTIPTQRG